MTPSEIRSYRLKLAMNQEQFGKEIGVSKSMVQKLEASENAGKKSKGKISKASEKLLRILLESNES